MPTYTGADHISDSLGSVISQNNIKKFNFEVIVVIDGPNRRLREIVKEQKKNFESIGIKFQIIQHSKNMGRFEARLRGAKAATNDYLLFLDDRNMVAKDYFEMILKSGRDAVIPNVLEENHPNFVSRTLYAVRKKLYSGKWGGDFKSYDIDLNNFEASSKGTAGFWIKKRVFINACNLINNGARMDIASDDTKILKSIVDGGSVIYKSSEARIFYEPRKKSIEELKHIFHRGPLFIDYYLRPGRRFFLPLVAYFTALPGLVLLAVFVPAALIVVISVSLVLLVLLSLYVYEKNENPLLLFFGLACILSFFLGGLVWGLVIHAFYRWNR